MDYFVESEKIYSPKSKEYFKEVLSSYGNENYRSAIVMLYAVCICDLLFKLEELRDVYNDNVAKAIIEDIEKHKIKSKSKSTWEKELVDSIKLKTNLLDYEAHVNLTHLFDYRNLSAHPALNGDLNLISPPKEIVAAYIRTSLDSILLKPAVFVKDVIHTLLEDLDSKKGYILSDVAEFERYVNNKYLSRMNDLIFTKTFQTIWKFTFRMVNEDCNNNRKINCELLKVMYDKRKTVILSDIDNNTAKYEINDIEGAYIEIFKFLGSCHEIYGKLCVTTKMMIDSICQKNNDYKLVSWFKSNKSEHIKSLVAKNEIIHPSHDNILNYILKSYKNEGLTNDSMSYLIILTNDAHTYYTADEYFQKYIKPNLSDMTTRNIEALLNVLNNNSQFYTNWNITTYCSIILNKIDGLLPSNYDFSKYTQICKFIQPQSNGNLK